MKRQRWMVVLVLHFACIGPLKADDVEDRVVATLRELGGRVTRDKAKVGMPVVAVDLYNAQIKPDTWEEIARLKHLTRLVQIQADSCVRGSRCSQA